MMLKTYDDKNYNTKNISSHDNRGTTETTEADSRHVEGSQTRIQLRNYRKYEKDGIEK